MVWNLVFGLVSPTLVVLSPLFALTTPIFTPWLWLALIYTS